MPRWGSVVDRFWSYVPVSEVGCWEWKGHRNTGGYGVITHNGRDHTASRVSWEIHFGPIPDGLSICHHCDNPPCVRPDHLFIGTHSDNMRDAFAKGRLYHPRGPGGRKFKEICVRGHLLSVTRQWWGIGDKRHPYCSECRRIKKMAKRALARQSA